MTSDLFLESILRPALLDIAHVIPYTKAAEKLLLMTACHESMNFAHREQMGGGPAKSFFQIEPNTLFDLYKNYARYRENIFNLLEGYRPGNVLGSKCKWRHSSPTRSRLAIDLMDDTFSAVAARLIYWRVPQPIPEFDDDDGMARMWKRFYNTDLGKGTVDKFIDDWNQWKPKGY